MNKDCFANQGTSCMILCRMECRNVPCAFYKTSNERERGQQKAKNRLRGLSEARQEHIAWRYYRNSYPWRREGK
jgi:hypothetical protein